MIGRARLIHERPPFGIDEVTVGGEVTSVREETALSTPFASLLHFAKDVTEPQPVVLLVTALAGHFSTLLRATVRSLLADHDVYVTDWHNARDIGLEHGDFGLADYIDDVFPFLDPSGSTARDSWCRSRSPFMRAATCQRTSWRRHLNSLAFLWARVQQSRRFTCHISAHLCVLRPHHLARSPRPRIRRHSRSSSISAAHRCVGKCLGSRRFLPSRKPNPLREDRADGWLSRRASESQWRRSPWLGHALANVRPPRWVIAQW